MRKIKKIIIHCTDSEWGDKDVINQWHKERGFSEIGYHFLILNAYPNYSSLKNCRPVMENDGMLVEGRDIAKVGAHCKNHNLDSVGIALVGRKTFSKSQLKQLVSVCKLLLKHYDLGITDVYGHYEFDAKKSCPNLDMDYFREKIFYAG